MATARTILSLGACDDVATVHRELSALHAQVPIERLFTDRLSPTDLAVACWARDGTRCAVEPWPGAWAIKQGTRPPVVGIDRLRAILADAEGVRPEFIVWGTVPAFHLSSHQRVRGWDVPPEVAVELAQRLGLGGWWLIDDALRPLRCPAGAKLTPCVAESPAT